MKEIAARAKHRYFTLKYGLDSRSGIAVVVFAAGFEVFTTGAWGIGFLFGFLAIV